MPFDIQEIRMIAFLSSAQERLRVTYISVVPPVVFAIFLWVLAMLVSRRLYKRAPFRNHKPPKPTFVWFPKYETTFQSAPEAIRESLCSLGFESHESDHNAFTRGKWYGDFSLRLTRLKAEIDPEQRAIRLSAPRMILFDTGDMWQLTQDIVSAAREEPPPR